MPEWKRDDARGARSAEDVMVRDVKTASAGTSLQAIAMIMREAKVGIVPIVDEERRLVGVVTDRDITVGVVASGISVAAATADDLMIGDVVKVHRDDSLKAVLERMESSGLQRLPVVDQDGRLLGIVSISDIAFGADHASGLQDTISRLAGARAAAGRHTNDR